MAATHARAHGVQQVPTPLGVPNDPSQVLPGTYLAPTLALHSEEAPKDGGHIFLALVQLIICLERNNQRTVNNKVGCRESVLSGFSGGTAQGGWDGEQRPQRSWVGC